MPAIDKELMYQELSDVFKSNPYAFFTTFDGLTVEDISSVRRDLEKVTNRSMVVKHTLARRILKDMGVDGEQSEKFLTGSLIVAFGDKDPQDISKTVVDFAKKNENWKPVGVVFEGKAEDVSFVKQLSKLPSRQELLAQMVLRMNSPISGFVTALGGLTRGLVVALDAVRKQKESAAA